MDNSVLMGKIEALSRCIARIRQKTPQDVASLEADLDTQDIIVLNLQRAVQITVDMATYLLAQSDAPSPTSMAESFTSLHRIGAIDAKVAERMREATGFRNLAVHEYTRIEWAIVYSIITTQLDCFRQYAEQLLRFSSTGEA